MTKTATIRMPAELYDSIHELAWKDKMSMNAWCVEQLRIAVNECQIRNTMLAEIEASRTTD